MAAHGDELTCDFAQFYHVLDWRALPVALASVLAAGLPAESRSVRRLQGLPVPLETLLLAAATDRLSLLLWRQTRDGQAGRNPPPMLTETLLRSASPRGETKPEIQTFASGADFLKAYYGEE